jgi:hypothetical protein
VGVLGAWRWIFGASALLALIAGLMLFAGATETDRFFSWTIEPAQTAAFLGATYWAVVILFAWASARRTWSEIRMAALAEATAAVLLLAATLLHLDQFHDDLLGYFWIAVYALAAPALAVLVLAARGASTEHRTRQRPVALPRGLQALLAAQALVFAAYGVSLFLFPGSADAAWPWPLTPLTGRAVGAFLCGFAVAAALALRDPAPQRLRAAAWTYLALGALELLGAALHGSDFSSDAALAAFMAFCASLVAAGAWGLLYAEHSSARAFSMS